MTVAELIKELSKYPQDMEVVVEHQKQSIGTFGIYMIFEAEPDVLETNYGFYKENVLMIRVK